jgi:hypothetical protein
LARRALVGAAPVNAVLWAHVRAHENGHGKVTMSGPPLTQMHAAVMDALICTARKSRRESTGAISILVDPATVRRVAGGDYRMSIHDLRRYLDHMIATMVHVIIPSAGIDARGALVADVVEGRGPGGRLWRVTFGATATALVDALCVRYPVAQVNALGHGVTQALARYLLTQSPSHQPRGGWVLEHVLDTLGVPASGQARRDARRQIMGDVEELRALGIMISDGRCMLGGIDDSPPSV